MGQCKICDKEVKGGNYIGLSRHISFQHNMTLLEYCVKFEKFEVPICICGKICKHIDSLKFAATCGDKKCVKQVQRAKRLKFMKENPHKTAWRQANMSYPEKVFRDQLVENGLDKKYEIIREYCVFPFYIDFAFINEKVAVEIDGSQHTLNDVKEKDKRKDKKLLSEGWRVFRITSKQVKTSIEDVLTEVEGFIGGSKTSGNCGIKEYKTKKKKYIEKIQKEREKNGGLTDREIKDKFKQRRVERPPYQQLIIELGETSCIKVGKKYGVSDNTIRKWIKFYEKYENK